MWIRDSLPKHLTNVRAVLYGYDTRLHDSISYQSIPDLANSLINHLRTYGWDTATAKPIAFLAHDLGGLVLREALVQLDQTLDKSYKHLLGLIRGAVFFGVPNLGMEQKHLMALVRDNPNEALIEDIARNSNYLHTLNEQFDEATFKDELRCFWAFETCKSPTLLVRIHHLHTFWITLLTRDIRYVKMGQLT